MKSIILPVSLSLALLGSATAQKMGSSNTNAPSASSSIAFNDGLKLEVKYTSITWAGGKMMTAAADKEKGERARGMINKGAESNPLGEFTTSADVTLGGKKVAAGSYDLAFTIDAELKWHLMLTSKENKETKLDWKLDLTDSGHESKRLAIWVQAGDADGAAMMGIAFGKMACMIPCGKGGGADKADAGHGKGDAKGEGHGKGK